MDSDVEVFQRKGVSVVSIQSVSLFYEQSPARPIALKECDHFGELFSTGNSCGFDLDKFAHDLESFLKRSSTEQLYLSLDGVAFLTLFTAGNTGLENGGA